MRLRANLWLHLGSYSSPVGTMLKIRAFGCWWVWMVQKGGYALPNPGMGPNTNSLVQMKSRTVHFQGRPHRRIAETLLVGRPKRRNNIARLIHYSTETLKGSSLDVHEQQSTEAYHGVPGRTSLNSRYRTTCPSAGRGVDIMQDKALG